MAANNEEAVTTQPFTYDSTDLRALNIQITRWWGLIPGLAALAFFAWLFGSIMLEDRKASWPLIALMTAMIFLFSGPWTWRPLLMGRIWRRQGLLVPQTITVTADHLGLRSERLEARVRWSAVRKIVRADGRLFIFDSKTSAYIVPRRALATDAEFDEFANAANQCWKRQHRL